MRRCGPFLCVVLLLLMPARAFAADVKNLQMPLPAGGTLLYGLQVPDGYQAGEPRPLVLALHPGGERMRYYGSAYVRAVVAPALQHLGAIIVAPDCPTNAWTDPAADAAVMALLEKVMGEFTIDRRHVVVVGFSMGGRGTWFMAAHHPDLFTAAIPMAAATGDEPVDTLGTIPTYIVHSRRDQVVPFAPAERTARELERLGRPVKFEALSEPTHFEMAAYIPALTRAGAWVADRWRH
jgi:predicted peptidase